MKNFSGSELEAKEMQRVYIGNNISMTIGQLTRWLLLLEAFSLITESSDERGVKIDEDAITKKAKPHKAIVKYINERYFAGLRDVIVENRL